MCGFKSRREYQHYYLFSTFIIMFIDTLLTLCLAHTTIIKDNDPRLLLNGVYQYAFTNEVGIFVAKAHEYDPEISAFECAHYIDFSLVKGKSKTINAAFSTSYEKVMSDDPSLGFYKINWVNYSTPKKGATFPDPYAKLSPYEEFSYDFVDYISNKKLDVQHNRAMRIMLGAAARSISKK